MDPVSAAKDIEAIRQGFGDEKLKYLGLSYGNLIGQTYAEIFPRTSVRWFSMETWTTAPILFPTLPSNHPPVKASWFGLRSSVAKAKNAHSMGLQPTFSRSGMIRLGKQTRRPSLHLDAKPIAPVEQT
jgi:pimeloyl-ACP methyl ester carboxylesterase